MTRFKPIADQVVVITGGSSGIGRCTARMAAARGARVVLLARNETALEEAAREIRADGGRVETIVADVADADDAERAAAAVAAGHGRIDTWVNNAGVGLYGRLMDLSVADMRRQFDVVY